MSPEGSGPSFARAKPSAFAMAALAGEDLAGDTWTHAFIVAALDEAAAARLLQEEGFAAPRALDERRLWLAATLAHAA